MTYQTPSQFAVSTRQLAELVIAFRAEMARGLAGNPGSIAMRPAFVGRPTGDERGRFIALDLGGTNVRASLVELRGEGGIRTVGASAFRLPSTRGSADDLFRPIAEFLSEAAGDARGLGFIFAFPMEQSGIRAGRLTKWTKEFAFDGVEGADVVELLERAIAEASADRPELRRLRVSALANDTVSAMAAGAYLDARCEMGLIVGTGTNMAVALPSRLALARGAASMDWRGEMAFNMECGNFDGVRAIRTEADRRLDAESDTQGQLLEKMISGRYLGEIARLEALRLAERGDAFDGATREGSAFRIPYAFTTEHLADIAADSAPALATTDMTLRRLGAPPRHPEDALRLRRICVDVSRRSARLAAMMIAATAGFDGDAAGRARSVAVDGSLFGGIPGYQRVIEQALGEMMGEDAANVRLAYMRDASGVGAAVIAAMAESGAALSS